MQFSDEGPSRHRAFGQAAESIANDDRLLSIAVAILAILIAAQLSFAFVGLNSDSFWVDELFTAWVLDTPTLIDTVRRTLTDVHPPFYYIVARSWVALFGLSEPSLRALSAVGAIAAALVIAIGARTYLSVPARAIAVGAAVTSVYWIEQSQNARMYGVGLALGCLLMILALRAIRELAGDGLRRTTAIQFLLLGGAYAFTQFYMFLSVGGLVIALLAIARRATDRAVLIAIGATILVGMAAFVLVLLRRTEIDIADTWFDASIKGNIRATRDALLRQDIRWPVAAVFLLFCFWPIRALYLHGWRSTIAEERAKALVICIGVVLVVIASGFLTSHLIAPNYSDRNVATLAPVLWIGAGLAIDVYLRAMPRPVGRAFVIVLALAIASDGFHFQRHWLPKRSEFRGVSAVAAQAQGCEGKSLPFAFPDSGNHDPAAIRTYYFNSYYFRRFSDFPIVLLGAGGHPIMGPATRTLLRDRIVGRDPCPLLIAVLHAPSVKTGDVARALRGLGAGQGQVAMTAFPTYPAQDADGSMVSRDSRLFYLSH